MYSVGICMDFVWICLCIVYGFVWQPFSAITVRHKWRLTNEDLFASWSTYSNEELKALMASMHITSQRHARRDDYIASLQAFRDRRNILAQREKEDEERKMPGPPGRYVPSEDPTAENLVLAAAYEQMNLEQLQEECSERGLVEYQLSGQGRGLRRRPAAHGLPCQMAKQLRSKLCRSDEAFIASAAQSTADISGLGARELRDLLSLLGVSRGDATVAVMLGAVVKFRVRRAHALFDAPNTNADAGS